MLGEYDLRADNRVTKYKFYPSFSNLLSNKMVSNVNVLDPGVLDIIAAESNGTAIVTIQGNLIEDKAIVYPINGLLGDTKDSPLSASGDIWVSRSLIPSTHAYSEYKVGSAGRADTLGSRPYYEIESGQLESLRGPHPV
ncbi:hypothetical protein Tco_0893227 [Tanacetum coccineum]|uniref:Uncharacterized protein n=1 Tax=Tanacetum coccineum TaxID=301880 RepID=A0ABQ5C873_9ASTR